MGRCFRWSALIAAGMVLGSVLNSLEQTGAAVAEPDATTVEQLNDIRNEVKQISTLLRSGTVKVVVVLNPDSK